MNKSITFLLLSSLVLSGCKTRDEIVVRGNNHVDFTAGLIQKMPLNMTNSEKRSQGDLNCDGIEDMFEINDTKFFTQDYKINFYEGFMNNKIREFKEPIVLNLGIKMSNWSDQVKMDAAYLNDDKCIDIVFADIDDDVLRLEVAMNQGGFIFTKDTSKMEISSNISFLHYFKELVNEISYSEDESLSDYLKMDWVDWNGDGLDDFILFVKDRHSLDMGIFITEYSNRLTPAFKSFENVWVQDFLYSTQIRNLDTGDFDGDGKGDVAVFIKSKTKDNIYTSTYAVAIQRDGELIIQEDKHVNATASLDFFSNVKKRDIVDENNDGKDDLIYITESNDKPIRIVWLSK